MINLVYSFMSNQYINDFIDYNLGNWMNMHE